MLQKIKNIYHLFQAIVANIYYGFPSRKLKVIGVTGTDGKTTTTHLIYHILKTAGKKVSMISTVYAKVGNEEFDTGLHTTTPSSFLVQRLLKKSAENGDEYFVLETTSHALDQNRVYGIGYYIAVVTNITHEHLDYHKNYNNYLLSKAKMIKQAKIAVLNSDDHSYDKLNKTGRDNEKRIYQYGFKHKSDFHLNYQGQLTQYNRYNYLASSSIANLIGIDDKIIAKALDTFQLPPGRLETVYDKDFKVIIDFAHTPNAFRQLLPEIRRQYLKKGGHLIHVFGAAGLRDKSKRVIMGKESSKFSDRIILTEEDYRTESLDLICQAIAKGINRNKAYEIISERDKAIEKAISQAKKNDTVLITGKSHEKSLCRGKKEYPWDEFKAVKNAIERRK